MIRTDAEYRRALAQLSDEADTLRRQREALAGAGLSASEVDRAMEPLLSFRAQLQDEVDAYNQMRHGDLGVLSSLRGIGRWLIGARIARGLSQADLAEQLSVDPSQVSVGEMDALPGAGSAPGVTMPSIGLIVGGDHLAALRTHPVPVIARARDGRTSLDLRTVEPGHIDVVVEALARVLAP